MTLLDWAITVVPLAIVLAVAWRCRRYVRGVADFMSGGRVADRFLISIAGGELQAGAVVFVALFEVISHSGFSLTWWGWLTGPVYLLVGISGFVVYRFRETRAMTLAQFFELRYSKAFRVFTGGLGFVAGILNFGIIPAVGARCLAYFWELPETFTLHGFAIPTYVVLMALFLSVSTFISMSGGLVTVIVVNCLEGIVAQVFYLLIIAALLWKFDWSQIVMVLQARPPGQSFLNPFDSGVQKDFNVWFVLMGLASTLYGTMAWQNAAGYQGAALTPHEARMGVILGRWREMGKSAVITLLAVCAMTYLAHPDFTAGAVVVSGEVSHISDPKVGAQMQMPIAVMHLLPVGIKGVLCAIFLMGIFGGDATHLHSWGCIFVQDVLVPLRRRPFEAHQHIWALRCSILGVAVFAFLFGALYRQIDYVYMWWSITTAIYVGGIGSAIIGGLYWKKGTTTAAWSALMTGSALSVGGIVARQIDASFPFNGVQIAFASMLVSVALYIAVSFLTCRQDFDMDRLLHRGIYVSLHSQVVDTVRPTSWWARLVGVDDAFSTGDKWIVGLILGCSLLLSGIFVVGTTWNFFEPWPNAFWPPFWHFVGIGFPIFFAALTGIWFTWGGVRSLIAFFPRLRQERINAHDDGTVMRHENLDEQTPV